MGCGSSASRNTFVPQQSAKVRSPTFAMIPDQFNSLPEVQDALRKAGLESSNLIIAVDFTKSNEHNGLRSFGGRSLHFLDPEHVIRNPYESVIDIIGRTLEAFDDDRLIPAFGFGDITTTDKDAFPFFPQRVAHGFQEVLDRYREIVPLLTLSGPTSFAPVIYRAMEVVRETRSYHILLIIADGQVIKVKETIRAIVDASNLPLSIVMVGVGDGPWDTMEEFDDALPQRRFDNFQFVNFTEVMSKCRGRNPDAAFAVAALMEIPDQFKAIRKLGLLEADL